MKQERFGNEQTIRILREADQDSVAVVVKRHGVSDATDLHLAKEVWLTRYRRG